MDLEQALNLIKIAVKFTGTIDQKHIDLTVIPAEKRAIYEKALAICQISIKDGKMSREEFIKRVHLDS